MNGRSRPKAAPDAVCTTTNIVSDQPTITGIDRALANSDEWQLGGFLAAIKDLPVGYVFMTEDIIDGDAHRLPIDSPNRAGAWTAHAARLGLIERVSYAKARKASRAGGVSAVWKRCG
jgi:hypothetical protein